jgi:hypothetical protein
LCFFPGESAPRFNFNQNKLVYIDNTGTKATSKINTTWRYIQTKVWSPKKKITPREHRLNFNAVICYLLLPRVLWSLLPRCPKFLPISRIIISMDEIRWRRSYLQCARPRPPRARCVPRSFSVRVPCRPAEPRGRHQGGGWAPPM